MRLEKRKGMPVVWLVTRDGYSNVFVRHDTAYNHLMTILSDMEGLGMSVNVRLDDDGGNRFISLSDKQGGEHRLSLEWKALFCE